MPELSKNIEYLREKAAALPRVPGVYIMQNESGNVIYVGKSRSLRDRVSQYFHGAHDVKTSKMASSVHDFRFITCDTEMEALALENSLIKQYSPKYNIRLKDAKAYPYIKINIRSPWPRITMSRRRLPDDSLYFGPYSSTQTVYEVISQLERTLKIPSCKRRFPEDFGSVRPCVYYQIGRCMGVCTGKIDQTEYRETINRAAEILRGGTGEVISELTEKMMKASDELEFEAAARYRDSIEALRKLGERQKAVGAPDVECDVIGLSLTAFCGENVKFRDAACVFYIRSGYIADSEHFIFGSDEITSSDNLYDGSSDGIHETAADTTGENSTDNNRKIAANISRGKCPETNTSLSESAVDDSPLTAFIMSLYQSREYIPRDVMLSFELPEHERLLLEEYMTDVNLRNGIKKKVYLRTPKKGASKYLCDMAVHDAARHSENAAKREKNNEKTLISLASELHLEVIPERIEAYDISNLGDEHITAGMVVLIDGAPKKSEYRTFSIRSMETQDDYAAMSEAIVRRLSHIGAENDSMSAYPDLILLDGGAGHVSVIKKLLAERGFEIPVFGMVKDEHHKTRTLIDETGEINIARQADVFRLIYNLQEEVHRYTISRMTKAKRKTMKMSSLEKIKGIGPKKAEILLDTFKTITSLKKASAAELSKIHGISNTDADEIYNYFRKK